MRRRLCACLMCIASFITPVFTAANHLPAHGDHPGHIHGLT